MRYALTDAEWRLIQPTLPCKPRGVPRVDDRRVLQSQCRKNYKHAGARLNVTQRVGFERELIRTRFLDEAPILTSIRLD
jgi:transposase